MKQHELQAIQERMDKRYVFTDPDTGERWIDGGGQQGEDLELLMGEIKRLQGMLADCYEATGADPDGNEDWRLAEYALQEVSRMRREFEESEDELDWLSGHFECEECDHNIFHADGKCELVEDVQHFCTWLVCGRCLNQKKIGKDNS